MKRYFYSDGEQQFGPYSLEELREKNIDRDTLVWHPGLDSWVPASESDELKELWHVDKPPIIDLPDDQVPDVYEPKVDPAAGIPSSDSPNYDHPPRNWLLESILVTILCCNPIGIVGIVYAAQVDTLFYRGEHEKAHNCSRNAGIWTRVAFGVSLFLVLFYFFSLLLAFLFC
jgi:hypothetical protein